MRMCNLSFTQSSPQTLATVWRMHRTHPRVVTSSMRISRDRSVRLAGMPTAGDVRHVRLGARSVGLRGRSAMTCAQRLRLRCC